MARFTCERPAAYAQPARTCGLTTFCVPQVDAPEAALVRGVDVIPVDNLVSLVGHLQGVMPIEPCEVDVAFGEDEELPYVTDMEHIKG